MELVNSASSIWVGEFLWLKSLFFSYKYIFSYSDNRVVVYTKAISELQVASVQKPLRGWSVSRGHTQLPSYMGVSLNGGTPQSPPQNDQFFVGKNQWLLGITILGTPHIQIPMRFVVFFLGGGNSSSHSEPLIWQIRKMPWDYYPGRCNGWNLQPSPMKRKEKDLNQTSMRKCSMLIFRGGNDYRLWFDKTPRAGT